MPTDISRSREGENQKSDQAPKDASSRNGGRVRDFATWPFQRHEKQRQDAEQQTKGKGPVPAERKNLRAIGENGQPVERTVNLRNRYGKDHPGLKGGMNRGYRYWIEGGENDPEHEPSSGRDLNQGLAVNMRQQREAQRQQPDASSSRQGDIPEERKNDIKELIENLIQFPGNDYRNERIRVDMRTNKMNQSEYAYAKGYINGRGDIDDNRKKTLKNTICQHYH
jgi:hypothetical protein